MENTTHPPFPPGDLTRAVLTAGMEVRHDPHAKKIVLKEIQNLLQLCQTHHHIDDIHRNRTALMAAARLENKRKFGMPLYGEISTMIWNRYTQLCNRSDLREILTRKLNYGPGPFIVWNDACKCGDIEIIDWVFGFYVETFGDQQTQQILVQNMSFHDVIGDAAKARVKQLLPALEQVKFLHFSKSATANSREPRWKKETKPYKKRTIAIEEAGDGSPSPPLRSKKKRMTTKQSSSSANHGNQVASSKKKKSNAITVCASPFATLLTENDHNTLDTGSSFYRNNSNNMVGAFLVPQDDDDESVKDENEEGDELTGDLSYPLETNRKKEGDQDTTLRLSIIGNADDSGLGKKSAFAGDNATAHDDGQHGRTEDHKPVARHDGTHRNRDVACDNPSPLDQNKDFERSELVLPNPPPQLTPPVANRMLQIDSHTLQFESRENSCKKNKTSNQSACTLKAHPILQRDIMDHCSSDDENTEEAGGIYGTQLSTARAALTGNDDSVRSSEENERWFREEYRKIKLEIEIQWRLRESLRSLIDSFAPRENLAPIPNVPSDGYESRLQTLYPALRYNNCLNESLKEHIPLDRDNVQDTDSNDAGPSARTQQDRDKHLRQQYNRLKTEIKIQSSVRDKLRLAIQARADDAIEIPDNPPDKSKVMPSLYRERKYLLRLNNVLRGFLPRRK